MGKHKPNVLYASDWTRRPAISVSTGGTKTLKVAIFPEGMADRSGFSFVIPRRLARLLARRINQCLDDTL